jgi:hypothetical protein
VSIYFVWRSNSCRMTGSVGNYRRARRNMKKHFFLFFVYTLPRRGSSYTPRNCSCFLTLSSCIYNYRYTSLSQHTILLHQCRHLLISIEMSQFFFILRREKRKELVYGVCVFRVWESAFLGAFFFAVSFVAVVALQPCLALSLSPHVYCLGCVTFLLLFLSLFARIFFFSNSSRYGNSLPPPAGLSSAADPALLVIRLFCAISFPTGERKRHRESHFFCCACVFRFFCFRLSYCW